MTFKYFILYLFLFTNSISTFCQNTFNKAFDFEEVQATIFSSVLATDSCYYITGVVAPHYNLFHSGALFVKLDLEGNLENKTIHIDSFERNIEMWRPSLNTLPDGNFAVSTYNFDTIYHAAIVKFSPNGDTLFIKQYNNPFNEDRLYTSYDLKVFPNGDFLIVNFGTNDTFGSPDSDVDIIKTDSLGNIIWRKQYGFNNYLDASYSAFIKDNGNVVIGGLQTNKDQIDQIDQNFFFQSWIFEVDTLGNKIWEYLSPANVDLFSGPVLDMLPTSDGGIICASHTVEEHVVNSVFSAIRSEPSIFKLNASHQLEWMTTVRDEMKTIDFSALKVVHAHEEDGYVMLAEMFDYDGTTFGKVKGYLGKYSLEGDSVWGRFLTYQPDEALDSIGNDYALDFDKTPDGGYIIVGQLHFPDATTVNPYDVKQIGWAIKVDNFGCLVPGCHIIDDVIEQEEARFELKMYPNPTSDFLNVFFRNHVEVNNPVFRITDISGKEIRLIKGQANEETLMIPVWNYPKGVYFLQLTQEGKILKTEKFIVQ